MRRLAAAMGGLLLVGAACGSDPVNPITVDPDGNLIVDDTGNWRLRKITFVPLG